MVRRRRIVGVVVGGVAGVALAAMGGLAFRMAQEGSARIPATTTTTAPGGNAESRPAPARPLVYAEGQTLHLGHRTISTGVDILSLQVLSGR